ncbi:MAG: hypothetical protein NT027_15795 [Proteobacteria bacterium]|nr:hypothetical protein [Pseudomonadota bacterium]
MDTWADRSLRALKVYLDRGALALADLREKKFDEADELLRKRKAAFLNFKAADHLALLEGYTEDQRLELQTLTGQINDQNQQLMESLEEAKGQLGSQLQQLSKARAAVKKYRSNEFDEFNFEKSV